VTIDGFAWHAQASTNPASLKSKGFAKAVDAKFFGETAVTELALKAYSILGCTGIARFDFIMDTDKNEIYFNEPNPIPGSLAFYLWAKSRPPRLYTESVAEMVEAAQRGHYTHIWLAAIGRAVYLCVLCG
jgi:D-ala D-ala ligase C-terminus